MNQELIPHVFASLQTLERYVEQLRTLVGASAEFSSDTRAQLPEFERIVKQMRRTANKLQFQVASNDQDAIVRSLKIFYGLNHMVRPEVLSTLVKLTKGKTPVGQDISASAIEDVH